ncbi:MAG: hypothetical protein ACI9MB_004894, partial [Verrucomicrobiales bacterium]
SLAHSMGHTELATFGKKVHNLGGALELS